MRRKAGGRTRRERQFRDCSEIARATAAGGVAECDRQAVLAFLDRWRAVEQDFLEMAVEIGGRYQQVDRMAVWQQRIAFGRCGHGFERICNHPGKTDAAERRGEPARADQARDLAPNFGTGLRCHRAADDIARALEHEPDQRLRPELGETAPRFGVGVQQDIDVRTLQPHRGQWFKALPSGDGLRQEHAVDPARAGARNDVRKKAQAQIAFEGDFLEQAEIDGFHASDIVVLRVVKRTTGAGGVPQLLGYAMHVHRETDAAIADECDAQFFLPHWRNMAGMGPCCQYDIKRQSCKIGRQSNLDEFFNYLKKKDKNNSSALPVTVRVTDDSPFALKASSQEACFRACEGFRAPVQ